MKKRAKTVGKRRAKGAAKSIRGASEELQVRIAGFPKAPGVYLMKDARGRVLYVGKAADLRARVMSYFRPGSSDDRARLPMLMSEVADVEALTCESEVDALLMESRLIKDIQPRYNVSLKDDKTYPVLEITAREDFPRVRVTREPARTSRVFGPFIDAGGLRAGLRLLQRVFKFRTCKLSIDADDAKRKFSRPCLLFYIECCSAPCAERISKPDYADGISELVKFLSGKQRDMKKRLKRKMTEAADERAFEKAARYRDQLEALESLSRRSLKGDYPPGEALTVDPVEALRDVEEIFELSSAPRTIEGIDVANLSGKEAVGALVSFVDGRPYKEGYRRFRIKTVKGVDDYRMIEEVVTRRFKKLTDRDAPLPDVLVIDGGRGHLNVALKALRALDVEVPLVLGLAKKEEEIYISARRRPMRLERTSGALKLLQHVRDEAHRFAQHYHHLLRRKKTFARVLGPTTKLASGAAKKRKKPEKSPKKYEKIREKPDKIRE